MPEATGPTVEDRLDIAELLAHYARALDTGDTKAFAATFTADGVLNLPDGGRYRGAFTGREQIMQFAESFKDDPAFPGGQHFVSQITIEGDVQRCFVRSYVMRTLRMPTGPAPSISLASTKIRLSRWAGNGCSSRGRCAAGSSRSILSSKRLKETDAVDEALDIETEVRWLADRARIGDLLHQYAFGLDTRDWDSWAHTASHRQPAD
jgi:hypothetical protein